AATKRKGTDALRRCENNHQESFRENARRVG
ncbi:hypothetical protein A2U01_0079574, partial [Trifolium medium]|nr:hypothetical protein [Trifolium medium]